MVVADHLYRNHPDLPEGDLTRTRAALVCEESLVVVAEELGLKVLARLPIDPAVAEACDAGRVESLDTTELEPALQAILAR